MRAMIWSLATSALTKVSGTFGRRIRNPSIGCGRRVALDVREDRRVARDPAEDRDVRPAGLVQDRQE